MSWYLGTAVFIPRNFHAPLDVLMTKTPSQPPNLGLLLNVRMYCYKLNDLTEHHVRTGKHSNLPPGPIPTTLPGPVAELLGYLYKVSMNARRLFDAYLDVDVPKTQSELSEH